MNDEMQNHFSVTLKHINSVREKIWLLIRELDERAKNHDSSKLESPQAEIFARGNAKLASLEYGSEEYKASLEEMKPALDSHYALSRHHPEHWENGIEGMDLLDILEMLVDWISSTERNRAGNVHKVISANTERFNISEQLAAILNNTVERYF